LLSLLAVFIIHSNFSYPTLPTWIPDPFFRIYVHRIHKDKHGSDSGTYDTEGRFVPQKFEDMFAKYAEGKDGLTIWDVSKLLKGQRLIADPIGWGGAFFECRLPFPQILGEMTEDHGFTGLNNFATNGLTV
jgi:peroxygenase